MDALRYNAILQTVSFFNLITFFIAKISFSFFLDKLSTIFFYFNILFYILFSNNL